MEKKITQPIKDSTKLKLREIDPQGHINIEYSEAENMWFWEDYDYDEFRDYFDSEEEALTNIINYLETRK